MVKTKWQNAGSIVYEMLKYPGSATWVKHRIIADFRDWPNYIEANAFAELIANAYPTPYEEENSQ